MTAEEPGPARINVPLNPGTQTALAHIQEVTGLSKVTVVNQSIRLLEFVHNELLAGRELVIRQADGTEQMVKIFL